MGQTDRQTDIQSDTRPMPYAYLYGRAGQRNNATDFIAFGSVSFVYKTG